MHDHNITSLSLMLNDAKLSYAMRRVPGESLAGVVPMPGQPVAGQVGLARVARLGRNSRLETPNGRRSALHHGDLMVVVFGNRYATLQFEGYSRMSEDGVCDLLSSAGVCGEVASQHAGIGEPTKLKILGAIADVGGQPLQLRDFRLAPVEVDSCPEITIVVGSSMDSGKTHTARSIVRGYTAIGEQSAAIKLTGTATGRDTWSFVDAGASPVYDFIDAGYPSTYRCTVEELIEAYRLLVSNAADAGAAHVVIEIADGVLQQETAALLRSSEFTSTVSSWVFAAGDPIAAFGGVHLLRSVGIDPVAVSGLVSRGPLAVREIEASIGLRCLTDKQLERGDLWTTEHKHG